MAIYPTAIATTTDLPDIGANLGSYPHDDAHNEARDEIIALETEGGVAPSGSFSTVRARLDSMWQKIASSNSISAATTFDITIPSSTYIMVRITIWGFLAAGSDQLLARVNNDSTAGLHRFENANVANDIVASAVNTSSTSWRIGDVNTIQASVTELTIVQTNAASRCPYQSRSGMYATTEAAASNILASGSLSADRTISSIRIFPLTSTFTGGYYAEGVIL